jgi:hypothetical protein
MKILRYLLIGWLPVFLWMAVIFSISADHNPYRAIPDAHQPTPEPHWETPEPNQPTSQPNQSTPAPNQSTPESQRPTPVTPPGTGSDDIPRTELRPQYEAFSRLAHVAEYAILAFLFARATTSPMTGQNPLPPVQLWKTIRISIFAREASSLTKVEVFRLLLAFGLTIAFAFSDELHQTHVAGRTYQNIDLLLDTLGAAAGVLLFVKLSFRLRRSPAFEVQGTESK